MDIKSLSLEERIGQTLIVGLDVPVGKKMYETIDIIIDKYKAGGICLYRKNYNTYEELVKVINYIKEKSSKQKVPIIISLDQEGGRVNRLPKDFLNLPSANKLAKYSSKENDLVRQAGELTGKILKKLGIDMDFAPVLDIKRFPDNHAIGDRAFSGNVDEVCKYGLEYAQELQKQGIIPVVKHFPGHGATNQDTHFTLPKINYTMSELKEDLKPFKKAIKKNIPAILIGHLVIKRETGKLPASLSKRFITKYIRKKYHYNGLIITDDIRMKAIRFYFIGKFNPVKIAFDAGNDMIMLKYLGNEEKWLKNIEQEIRSGIMLGRLDRKVNRILKAKEEYGVNTNKIKVDKDFVQEVNSQIKTIRERCGLKS